MSEFRREKSEFQSLLQEYEELVESDKRKSLDTTTENTCVSGQDFAHHPQKRQRFDSTTMKTSGSGAYEDPPKEQRIKWQISEMEKSFQEISKPSKVQRRLLSETIGLSTLDIQLWFQNRRSQLTINDLLSLESQVEKLQVEISGITQAIHHLLGVLGSAG